MDNLKIKLGQRLAVGFDGPTIPEEYAALVREYKIGNAILFRRNVQSYAQLKALCAELRTLIRGETGIEPFIMIDEECGSVSRLAHIAGQTPCAMAIGATDDPENAYRIGRIVGDELSAVGVNFDLAPVLDCFSNPDGTVGGNRCFAREPEKVAAFGRKYARGLQDAGVMACGKHFPGHGDTAVDSHLAMPVVEKTEQAVREQELVSFEAAIRGGIDGVMAGHVVFPAFEPERVPSTVSHRVVTGLLREELGFDGMILSDGMEMKAVMDMFGIEEATCRALDAGIDVALICHSAQQAASVSRYLADAAASGRLKADEIEAHYRRIVDRKARLRPSDCDAGRFGSDAQHETSRSIMRQAVRVLHAPEGKPLPGIDADALFVGTPAQAASLANDAEVLDGAAVCARAFGARCVSFASMQPESGTVVAILGKHPELSALTEAVWRMDAAGARVIAVSMGTPRCLDALSDSVWKVGAWQYDELSLDALIEMLKG